MNLEFNNKTPLYLQIANMIRDAILSGDLKENEPIPSVRQISVEYNINPQTILNATQILIQEELIEKRRGLGMYVKSGAKELLTNSSKTEFINEDIEKLINKAKLLGYTKNQTIQIIEDSFEKNISSKNEGEN
ncbi:MAG: GntR family transcriptional regulator [Candidatus Marinimicrobia bacterium]|nr:GntR family transcriptional regulator [Candidatus Neomarinimicrobiota bacterium]MBL7023444.1 GntR family transcriptional regulator [Candidatus Neomarinimicrobiota bacterium]MBL7108807.1 GntR family transcriptional regulator [Candidatus Neomarinimicrobiota bacterium]